MTARLPARIEAMGLIRAAQAAGGFGTVLHRGEPDAGALLVVLLEPARADRVFERMPTAAGERRWHCAREDDAGALSAYLARRTQQDEDLWIVELELKDGERLLG